MRILHTSDWHIGRTFHQHSTLAALDTVMEALVAIVREQSVDVVVAAGDIFDSSTPSGEVFARLDTYLAKIREAGAVVVMTSGNHDSPQRLGARAAFASLAGIHVLTEPTRITEPVTLADEHGDVHFYGLPFLEPSRMRHVWTDVAPESMRAQKDAVGYAMDSVRSDLAERGGRSVVLAHTFVQGAEGESCDSERDIVGGVDKVPVPYFDGVTYAALGHIHGRATLAEHVRYSGALLHYSFSEAGKARGGWLVDLDAEGLAAVAWVDLPVPRPLKVLTGTLDDLLTAEEHAEFTDHWVSAILTDAMRPLNAMKKLQTRFPHCAHLEHRPDERHDDGGSTYSQLVEGKTDEELIDVFLTKVRNGHGATDEEAEIVRDVTGDYAAKRATA